MPYFKWTGIDLYGNTRRGTMFARTTSELDEFLLKKEIALLQQTSIKPLTFGGIKQSYLIEFFKHNALLLQSGVLLPEALFLTFVHLQTKSIRLQEVISTLIEEIRNGASVKEAFGKYPHIFDLITVTMLDAGQESGALGAAFSLVATRLERKEHFYKKIRSALVTPAITFLFFIISMLFILKVIVPSFAVHFMQAGQTLPFVTRMVLSVSSMLNLSFVVIFCSVLCMSALLLKQLARVPRFKRVLDSIALSIPLLKDAIMQSAQSSYLQSLGLLLEQGVHLVRALVIARVSVANSILQEELIELEHNVIQGRTLSNAMRLSVQEFFSLETIALVAVGEESGSLGRKLVNAALAQEEKLLQKVTLVTTWLQPIVMLLLGVLVAALIFALYVPLFEVPQLF